VLGLQNISYKPQERIIIDYFSGFLLYVENIPPPLSRWTSDILLLLSKKKTHAHLSMKYDYIECG
jgi:hypothetical protein